MKKILFLLLLTYSNVKAAGPKDPAIFSSAKPWAYWWWPGNAVSEKGITHNLEAFAKAGFGGLHIIPIYGAKGYENQFLNYLSPAWNSKLAYVLKESKRLHLGIDLTLGTGWPYGGPQIGITEAAKAYKIQTLNLSEGETIATISSSLDKFPNSQLVSITSYQGNNFQEDLWPLYQQGKISNWKAKTANTVIYLFYQTLTQQKVKRAAPGGEGLVMDHFSQEAWDVYKQAFVTVLKKSHAPLRAIYTDSYEVYGANFSPRVFDEFKRLNGYDLRHYLPVLAKSKAEDEFQNQVWADYHRTLADMLLNQFTKPWSKWIKNQGFLSRDQAHGSPGNLIDLYASVDIPETEFFGSKPYTIPGYRIDPDYDSVRFGIPDLRNIKLASSAADIMGKKLVSCETATWLGNHFKVSLAQVKPIIDEVFVGGVNHVFYHGATYSPPEVAWPGWLFYASTNFNPQSHFWGALPELNKYIETCQSMLQKYPTDSDLLLYFPMEDIWHQRNTTGKTHALDLHANSRDWMIQTPFGKWSNALQNRGFQVDYVSDYLLSTLQVIAPKKWKAPSGNIYKMLLIPPSTHLSLETMELLAKWVKQGMPVYFLEHIPSVTSTWNYSDEQKERWYKARESFLLRVLSDPADVLTRHAVSKETMAEQGLSFIRKRTENGFAYFVTNLSHQFREGNVTLAKSSAGIEILNPLTQELKKVKLPKSKLLPLVLAPGESRIIRVSSTFKGGVVSELTEKSEVQIKPTSKIQVDFVQGAPNLTHSQQMDELNYWTKESSTHQFSGSAKYSFDFSLTAEELKSARVLHFDQVRDWVKVKLNGKDLGIVWSIPFQLNIPMGILKEENHIELEVTNVSANRIRQLDKEGGKWKNFYEINFVDIRYNPFDASNWPITDSGLQGKLYFSNR